jgi:hypothetical protein
MESWQLKNIRAETPSGPLELLFFRELSASCTSSSVMRQLERSSYGYLLFVGGLKRNRGIIHGIEVLR